MNNDDLKFCPQKMLAFTKQDALLRFVLKDLKSRGHEEEFALRVVFNGYVLNDRIMEDIYKKL